MPPASRKRGGRLLYWATMENLPNPLATPELPARAIEGARSSYATGRPSQKQQSYGALVSIVIIVAIIIVGAFYVWGKRLSQDQQIVPSPSADGQISQ